MHKCIEWIRRLLPLLLTATTLLLAVTMVSPEQWVSLGKQAALVAVGLQRPQQSAAYLEQRFLAAAQESAAAPVTAPTDTPAEVTQDSPIPPKTDGGGQVEEQQLSYGTPVAEQVAVKNNSGVDYDFAGMLSQGSPVTLADTDEPQVLIVHTHTCESYMSYYAGYYNADDDTRSTDDSENMVAVGEAIAAQLRDAGIGVIHDTTKHDYPEFSGAYDRSEATIKAQLAAHPSIRVVLDIHRDAMMSDDLTKIKPTATIAGRKAAQIMLVLGATDTADLPNSYCSENIRFGMAFQNYMQQAYDGLMRPMYLVDARYNQGLLAGSLLIEVGTDANTLSEAMYAGQLVGRGLGAVLKTN